MFGTSTTGPKSPSSVPAETIARKGPLTLRIVSAVSTYEKVWTKGTAILFLNGEFIFFPASKDPIKSTLRIGESWLERLRLRNEKPQGITKATPVTLEGVTFEDVTWYAPLASFVVRLVGKDVFVDLAYPTERGLVAWLLDIVRIREENFGSQKKERRVTTAPAAVKVEGLAKLWSRSFKLGLGIGGQKKNKLPERYWNKEWNPKVLKDDALKTFRIFRDFVNYCAVVASKADKQALAEKKTSDLQVHYLRGHVATQLYYNEHKAILSFAAIRWGNRVRNLGEFKLTVPVVIDNQTYLLNCTDLEQFQAPFIETGSPNLESNGINGAGRPDNSPQLPNPCYMPQGKLPELRSPFSITASTTGSSIICVLCSPRTTTQNVPVQSRRLVYLTNTDALDALDQNGLSNKKTPKVVAKKTTSWLDELVSLLGVNSAEQITAYDTFDCVVYVGAVLLPRQETLNSFISDLLGFPVHGSVLVVPRTNDYLVKLIPEYCISRPDTFNEVARLLGQEELDVELYNRLQRVLASELCLEQTETTAKYLFSHSQYISHNMQILSAMQYDGVPVCIASLTALKHYFTMYNEPLLADMLNVELLLLYCNSNLSSICKREKVDLAWFIVANTVGNTKESPPIARLLEAWQQRTGTVLIAPVLHDVITASLPLESLERSVESEYAGRDKGTYDQDLHYISRLIGRTPNHAVESKVHSVFSTSRMCSVVANSLNPRTPTFMTAEPVEQTEGDLSSYCQALQTVFLPPPPATDETTPEVVERFFDETLLWLRICYARTKAYTPYKHRSSIAVIYDAIQMAESSISQGPLKVKNSSTPHLFPPQRESKGHRCFIAIVRCIVCPSQLRRKLVLRAIFLVFEERGKHGDAIGTILFQLLRWLLFIIEDAEDVCCEELRDLLGKEMDSADQEEMMKSLVKEDVLNMFLDDTTKHPIPSKRFYPSFKQVLSLPMSNLIHRRIRNHSLTRMPSVPKTGHVVNNVCFIGGPELGFSAEDLQRAEGNPKRAMPLLRQISLPVDIKTVACGNRHCAIVTNGGIALTFGHGDAGRLGHGNVDSVAAPTVVSSLVKQQVVVSFVACGRDHTVFVGDSEEGKGKAFTCGWGEAGRLGLGGDEDIVSTPTLVSHFQGEQLLLPSSAVQITHVSCGASHTAFVSSIGHVFTCGTSSHGQLGHGFVDNHHDELTPRLIESIQTIPMNYVACGNSHTISLDRNGVVWAWGFGESGALGHGNACTVSVPEEVVGLKTIATITMVKCGEYHSGAVDDKGRVWCWGDNRNGQLGASTEESHYLPQLVRIPTKEDATVDNSIAQLECGGFTTVATTQDGRVFSWGETEGVKYGNNIPTQVDISLRAVAAAAGGHQMLILTSSDPHDQASSDAKMVESDDQADDVTDDEEVFALASRWTEKEWKVELRDRPKSSKCARVLLCGRLNSESFHAYSNVTKALRYEELQNLVFSKQRCLCRDCKEHDPLGAATIDALNSRTWKDPTSFNTPIVLHDFNAKSFNRLSSDTFACTDSGELYQWEEEVVQAVAPLQVANLQTDCAVSNVNGVVCASVRERGAETGSHLLLWRYDGVEKNDLTVYWPEHEESSFAQLSCSRSSVVALDDKGAVFQIHLQKPRNSRLTKDRNLVSDSSMESRIERMYRKYDPEKLSKTVGFLPKLLKHYQTREDELLEMLVSKYGPEPTKQECQDSTGFLRTHPILVNLKARIKQVSCGDWMTLAVSTTGRLYNWQLNEKPKLLPVVHNNRQLMVAKAACGSKHCAVVTTKGLLFTWGMSSCGQLGLGDETTLEVAEPTLVPLNRKDYAYAKEVACGDFHTACVTTSGKCIVFGSGTQGQLGLGDNENRNVPTQVLLKEPVSSGSKLEVELRAVDVYCGPSSTMFLCRRKSLQY